MTDVLVYAAASRAETARSLLGAACRATGIGARLELYGSGSLYQRLGPRHAPPLPDVVMWFGPFAAQAAAQDGLLQPYQPRRVADAAVHDPSWRWTTLDYLSVGVVGHADHWPTCRTLAGVPTLAIADPERSEVGLSMLLATLDRARQVEGDVERGWAWWQQRARSGLMLAEDDAGAAALVGGGGASHALSLVDTAAPLAGWRRCRTRSAWRPARATAMRRGAAGLADRRGGWRGAALSPWQAASNGLQALLSAAPALDVEWARQQYTATRQRWAQSGFAPTLQRLTRASDRAGARRRPRVRRCAARGAGAAAGGVRVDRQLRALHGRRLLLGGRAADRRFFQAQVPGTPAIRRATRSRSWSTWSSWPGRPSCPRCRWRRSSSGWPR